MSKKTMELPSEYQKESPDELMFIEDIQEESMSISGIIDILPENKPALPPTPLAIPQQIPKKPQQIPKRPKKKKDQHSPQKKKNIQSISRNKDWRCTGCEGSFSKQEVDIKDYGSITSVICRKCGGMCEEIKQEAVLEKSSENFANSGDFFRQLPRAFAYPFTGIGWLRLLFAPVFFVGLIAYTGYTLGIGWIIQLAILGYVGCCFFSIVVYSASGDFTCPPWPGMEDIVETLILPFFLSLGSIIVSFMHIPIYFYFFHFPSLKVLFMLFLLGTFIFPMTFLGVAILNSFFALNPVFIFRSIFKIFLPYLSIWIVFILTPTLAISFLVFSVFTIKFWPTLLSLHFWSILLSLIQYFFLCYWPILAAHLIGLIYFHNEKQLEWF